MQAFPRWLDVAGTSHDDVWLGSWTGTALHWDGKTLSLLETCLGTIHVMHAFAPADVWFGGATGLVHWDGKQLTTRRTLSTTSLWAANEQTLYAGATSYRARSTAGPSPS
jgi:hypothetical protein